MEEAGEPLDRARAAQLVLNEMDDQDWDASYAKSLQVFLNGNGIASPDPRGQQVVDDSFLILFNADANPVKFTMPSAARKIVWTLDGRNVSSGRRANRLGCPRRAPRV